MEIKEVVGIYSSEEIPDLTNNEISESNIKCEISTRQLWNDMSTKIRLLKELNIIVKVQKTIDNEPGDCIFVVCKKFIRKLKNYFFAIIDGVTVSLKTGLFLLP